MKKISVIVPFYNVESYIAECLDSLLAQTYRNIEILCIDDCSPDKSIDIVIAYAAKDERIKLIQHDKNKGLGGARNTGIKQSSGEYLCFVDSDDYVSDRFVELLYQSINKNSSDIAICGYCLKFDDRIANAKVSQKPFGATTLLIDNNKDNVVEIVDMFRGATWLKMYKRDLIVQNNIYQPEKRYYEDVVYWLMTVYFSSSISVIPDRLYYYRKRSDSIMASLDYRHIDDRFYFIRKIDDFVKSVILLTPEVDAPKVLDDTYHFMLKHIRYGKTLIEESSIDDKTVIQKYYYERIADFSTDCKWPVFLDECGTMD